MKSKFKLRCTRYLYTLAVTDKEKADKLKSSLPPGYFHDSMFVYVYRVIQTLRNASKGGKRSVKPYPFCITTWSKSVTHWG